MQTRAMMRARPHHDRNMNTWLASHPWLYLALLHLHEIKGAVSSLLLTFSFLIIKNNLNLNLSKLNQTKIRMVGR